MSRKSIFFTLIVFTMVFVFLWLYFVKRDSKLLGGNVNFSVNADNEAPDEKQTQPPTYEDSPVVLDTSFINSGPFAAIDFSSNQDAAMFRARLNEGVKDGPDFSGQYAVVEIGCGTACQRYWIVDLKTGRVYNPPQLQTERGVGVKIESNLIIADEYKGTIFVESLEDSGSITLKTPEIFPKRYYLFENGELRMIYRSRCVKNENDEWTLVCESKNSQLKVKSPDKMTVWNVGENERVSWTGGASKVSLFLIEASLKTAGTSVSMVERIYNLDNTGEYEFQVPETYKIGEYQWCFDDTEEYVCSGNFQMKGRGTFPE
jgi:hypothetical protein